MEIRLNRVELLKELVPTQGIVERRSTIPVLSHLLLRAIDDRLEVAATDLEVSLTSWCEAEVENEGAITIQAKKLLEIVRACESDDLSLALNPENGMLSIVAGKSRFKIRGLPADDFPTLPTLDGDGATEVPFAVFRAMIGKIFFAISGEESRFQLSGALLEQSEDVLRLVATDGHRLALVESAVEGLPASDGVLVPRKALQELLRLEDDGDLTFRRTEHHLSFTVGRRQLICRILEGTFPNYDQVIARDNDKHAVVGRQPMVGAIQRVSLLTGDRARAIRFELRPGEIGLTATNPDLGEANEDLACEYQGDTLSIGLNPDYLRDFLGAADSEKMRFELKDENSQCVVYPVAEDEAAAQRYLCVIMPIRI